jgi:hypothetical protein
MRKDLRRLTTKTQIFYCVILKGSLQLLASADMKNVKLHRQLQRCLRHDIQRDLLAFLRLRKMRRVGVSLWRSGNPRGQVPHPDENRIVLS